MNARELPKSPGNASNRNWRSFTNSIVLQAVRPRHDSHATVSR